MNEENKITILVFIIIILACILGVLLADLITVSMSFPDGISHLSG